MTQTASVAQDTSTLAPGAGERRALSAALTIAGKYGTIIGLVVMIAVLSIAAPGTFLSMSNFVNVLTQNSLIAIVACGMTLPLVVGEFDLSVGYQASFAGVLCVGLMSHDGLSIPLAVALSVAVGVAVGMINGLLVTKLGVNALIATLGTGTVVVGLNYAYTNGVPITLPPTSAGFLDLALGKFAGIPNPIIFMVLAVGFLWVLLNRTVLGQQMQAVGGNHEAARLSGVRVERVRVWAFVIAGIAAAGAGVLLSSRVGSGQLTAGDAYLLNSFAAVFLGSAALRDGEFHILGTLIGVMTVGFGFNGLAILGAPTFFQYIFSGGLLIVAVALSTVARRYARA
ncbi:ABC transporter permease [Nostocoides sp. HKS02]|uniref:ABC transporter permease n=1 Tax=Nostocoides sp. HKS02 TaxID=1813880 RepID=UPI0012B4568A|nr:ABC transporter permease [Tetrasphaera sp. HKS02]QGN58826.1 ABC transporter permease [Tetrasphaera sp. HKS02]